MYSSRLDWEVRANPIASILRGKRQDGISILDLTQSNPTQAAFEYPAADLTAALADPRSIRYEPEPFGLPEAREAVAAYYAASGALVPADRIILTASTSEAYAYLFKLLCNPGDQILTPRPSYPLFEYLAGLEAVEAVQYPLFYDHGWHLDVAALRKHITDRTRAIVAVNPNNPTGSYLKQHELGELNALAEQHNLAIISDEVFSDYALRPDTGRVLVAANHCAALSFSLNGLSKIVGLPQVKLGWMVVGGAEPLRESALERLELIADTYLSVGSPVQLAARTLLGWRSNLQEQILRRLKRNLQHLRLFLPRARCAQRLEVEGGWSVTIQVPRIRSEEEWVVTLLREHNVLVQPGYFYDFESEAFLVLSLLTEPAIFDQGVDRLVAVLSQAAVG
jgi:alanine-synthesizing transaminase